MSGKKRRLDSGDGLDDELQSMSHPVTFRVSTTAVGDVEFTADQDGLGKWVKLSNGSKNVSLPYICHSKYIY